MWRLKVDMENSPEEKEANPTNPEDLPAYIQPFTHLFNKKNFDKLPDRTEWDHEINLTSEAPKEISSKVYNMTPLEREELDRFLDENLALKESNPRNHLTPHHASSYQRKTNHYDYVRITERMKYQ
jgi:hypothetical protein